MICSRACPSSAQPLSDVVSLFACLLRYCCPMMVGHWQVTVVVVVLVVKWCGYWTSPSSLMDDDDGRSVGRFGLHKKALLPRCLLGNDLWRSAICSRACLLDMPCCCCATVLSWQESILWQEPVCISFYERLIQSPVESGMIGPPHSSSPTRGRAYILNTIFFVDLSLSDLFVGWRCVSVPN